MELLQILIFLFVIWFVFHICRFICIEIFAEGGLEKYNKDQENKEREEIRRFRTETTSGIFIDTVKKVERERPLTDEELDLITQK